MRETISLDNIGIHTVILKTARLKRAVFSLVHNYHQAICGKMAEKI